MTGIVVSGRGHVPSRYRAEAADQPVRIEDTLERLNREWMCCG
jgi:hypothetical protein